MKRVSLIAFLLLGAMLIFPQESLGQPQKGPLTSEEAIKKAQEDLVIAEKAVAEAAQVQAQAEKVVFEKITLAKEAAQKAILAAKAAAAAKDPAAKAAAEKEAAVAKTAAAKAAIARLAAEKELGQRTTALNAAKTKVDAAGKTILAEKAWMARKAAMAAEKAKTLDEKELTAKTTKAQAEQAKAAAAAKIAAKTAAEKAAAEKAFTAAPEAKKAEAKKILDQKTAAANKAAGFAALAKSIADKAVEEKAAVERVVAEKTGLLNQALDVAAQAHAEAIGGLKAIARTQWDYAKARHLLFRAGFGGTPEEVQRLVDMGPYKAVDFLVEYHLQPPPNIELDVQPWERTLAYETRLHAKARQELGGQRNGKQFGQLAPLRQWWLRRMVESPRPLEEKLALFWHDHFAASWLEVLDIYLMYQQNQLLRRYADKYDALLHGIVQDPAMIRYLTNDRNTKNNNNENLGREVLELFSMGEENSANHKKDGYTEKDVRDGMTRALTGFSYDRPTGQFRFYSSRHDTGTKTFLGRKGDFGPHEALDIVLQHPATARYITKKLYEFFVHFDPDPQVIDRLAHVLRENSYEIRPMLKNLFLSEEFYSSKALANHIKGPAELMVSTIKLLKLEKVNYQNLDSVCINMRQAFFDPPNVAGWPEGRAWVNAHLVLVRYNAVTNLVQQPNVDLVGLLDGRTLNSPAEVVDHFTQRCLLTNLSEEKRQALIDFLSPLPPSSAWATQRDQVNAKLRALLATLLSMPEYQVS